MNQRQFVLLKHTVIFKRHWESRFSLVFKIVQVKIGEKGSLAIYHDSRWTFEWPFHRIFLFWFEECVVQILSVVIIKMFDWIWPFLCCSIHVKATKSWSCSHRRLIAQLHVLSHQKQFVGLKWIRVYWLLSWSNRKWVNLLFRYSCSFLLLMSLGNP